MPPKSDIVALQPSPPIWIKICANTSAADALLAAELGANAVGFVFAPSTRRVNAAQVRAMAASLPVELERVGVFPTATPGEIAEAAVEARLHAVQLHGGGLTPEFLNALADRLTPETTIIPTVHWSVEAEADSVANVSEHLATYAETLPDARKLVDAKVGTSAGGGTGRTFDWLAARAVFASQPAQRLILAGGLHPGNVAHAIRLLRPWGIDVASGVEYTAGRKDPVKLRAFIKNARGA